MRLIFIVPRLLGIGDEALAAAPALATFTQYATPPTAEHKSMESALLTLLRQPEDTAIAPLAALGAGFDPLDQFVFRADPVTLIAGRDDVLLAGRVADLTTSEASALIALFNTHFISDGLKFHAPRPDAWFVTVRESSKLATTPLERVHGSIYPHLAQGEDAATWRRWMSEMQMLLHDHPINVDRETRGLAPVTGVWIAQGGIKGQAQVAPALTVVATAGPAGDVARGAARQYGADALPLPPTWLELTRGADTLAVLPAVCDAVHVALLNRDWFAPATAALERGEIKALTLLADGRGAVIAWTAEPPSWLARLKARFTLSPFTPPGSDADS
ncbi:MAG: hypothetical protein WKH97_03735 [Casimicrobiaceae bacterium]